jgi:hypothetical protein
MIFDRQAMGLYLTFLSTKYIVVVWYVSPIVRLGRPVEVPIFPEDPVPILTCIMHFAVCDLHLPRLFFAERDGERERRRTMDAADGPGQYGEGEEIISCGFTLLLPY